MPPSVEELRRTGKTRPADNYPDNPPTPVAVPITNAANMESYNLGVQAAEVQFNPEQPEKFFTSDFVQQALSRMMARDRSSGFWRPLKTDSNGTLLATDVINVSTVAVAYDGNQNPIYVGWAFPGTAKSAPAWRIQKNTYDGNDNLTDSQWAQGSTDFKFVWNSRTTYTYS